MSSDFENEIVRQLEELRATALKVAELNSSIGRATEELAESGNLATLNLNSLREGAHQTTQALNSLLSASDFFVTLRNLSEPTVIAISSAIDRADKSLADIEGRAKSLIIEATDQVLKASEVAFEPILNSLSRSMEDASNAASELEARNNLIVSATINNLASAAEVVNSKLEHVPVVLESMNVAGRNLTSQVSELTQTISGLKADLDDVRSSISRDNNSADIDRTMQHLYIAIPPSVATFCIGAFVLNLETSESITLTLVPFFLILFSNPSQKLLDLLFPWLRPQVAKLKAKLKDANVI